MIRQFSFLRCMRRDFFKLSSAGIGRAMVISLALAFMASSVPAAFGVEIGSPTKLRAPVAGSPGSPSTYQEVYLGDLMETGTVTIPAYPTSPPSNNYNHPVPQSSQDGIYTGAILWRVGGKSGNDITLISKYYPAIRQFRNPPLEHSHFQDGGNYGIHGSYPSSDIRIWLNNDNTGVAESELPTTRRFLENFNKPERDAVQRQSTVDSSGRGNTDVSNDPDGDYFWLLSASEVQSGWFPDISDRVLKGLSGTASADQQLRWVTRTKSTASGGSSVAFIKDDGTADTNSGGNTILDSVPIRPAFKLKLSSVLLTSGAVGVKRGDATSPLLEAATAPSGEMKLTIIDDGLSLGSVTPTSMSGWKVTFNYLGATPLKNLSAVIFNPDESEVKYYGNLHLVLPAGSGEASVVIPRDFFLDRYGDDKMRFFVEEISGDKKTDLASEPIAMTVSGTPITITRQRVSAPTTPQGGDNKISGVTNAMAYKPASADDSAWKSITGTTVSDISAGAYEVCYNGTISGATIDLPSDAKQVTVTGRVKVDDPPPGGDNPPPGKDGGGGCGSGVGAMGLLAAAMFMSIAKRRG